MLKDTYRREAAAELEAILAYWMKYTVDKENGGFYGQIDENEQVHAEAPKGSVLNSRILWAFSAAYNATGKKEYLQMADRAFAYITAHFIDREYGGVYWSVDYKGDPLSDRKQIYGLSFCIYGLSEYYKATASKEALELAIALFHEIEKHSYDQEKKGYFEAFARNWQPLADLRLSEKDANEEKTMNTHLHVIEAYGCLYQVWPDAFLKQQIAHLLEVFNAHIIDPQTGHLVLFFTADWERRSGILSYGHDIEAAWLLQEAAEIIGDNKWITLMKAQSVKIANAAMAGLDADGGLWYEYENGHLVQQKHSWPQAEAMVGFLNAWQVTGDEAWFKHSCNSWQFTRQYMKDKVNGEWFWGVTENHTPMPGQDKAGFWKCPYHNSRAMLEIIRRLSGTAAS